MHTVNYTTQTFWWGIKEGRERKGKEGKVKRE
jgi:hypothetical protein